MDVTILYNDLLDEIRLDEAALVEKKELARLLKKRLERERHLTNTVISPPPGQVSVTGIAPTVATFVQQVEQALPDLGQREFVVGDVADAMRSRGVQLPNKPNGKITTVLARLNSTGALMRTFTGGGNVPNRYMRVTVAGNPGGHPMTKEAPVSAT